ncbi:MAG TPA: SIR2 family protein, partial [Gemmataceae bacterium]|nr:SIR2 family protein [Gemmataceae bacterium]
MATPAQMLEEELVKRPANAMVVAGIGVSLATCRNDPTATWKGLLLHGLRRCADVCGSDETTLSAYRQLVDGPATPTHALITVGEFITNELKKRRAGLYGAWLSDSLGSIRAVDLRLVRALASLGVSLATTNYDSMIEAGTGAAPILWRNQAIAHNFFCDGHEGILHIHGHFSDPDSIILGSGSYNEICRDEFAIHALQSQLFRGTIVFVGCGAGLADPNLGSLLEWSRTVLANSHRSHFILVRTGDIQFWHDQL